MALQVNTRCADNLKSVVQTNLSQASASPSWNKSKRHKKKLPPVGCENTEQIPFVLRGKEHG
jgi:hypothetical protein